jgi:hypothetical protein
MDRHRLILSNNNPAMQSAAGMTFVDLAADKSARSTLPTGTLENCS